MRRAREHGRAPVTMRRSPDHTVRVSDRARRPRLVVDPRAGLVVVLPRGWIGDVDALLDAHRAWIERALAPYAERIEAHRGGPARLLPRTIELGACNERLVVSYRPTESGVVRIERTGQVLHVQGPNDPAARLEALSRWLDALARSVLVPWALERAARTGHAPARVRISRARTRWGSCSRRGTVSLSRSLLFLPPELVDAVVLHELVHLRVPGHSARFWAALCRLDPRAREHHRVLRHAWRAVPPWAEA